MKEWNIRIWDGCKVVQVISVSRDGSTSSIGATGGAENSTPIDLELDPWQGYIVDRAARNGVVAYREPQP